MAVKKGRIHKCVFIVLFPSIYRWNALNHCASGAHNSFSISWFWIRGFRRIFSIHYIQSSKHETVCWFTTKKKGKFLFKPNSIFIRRKHDCAAALAPLFGCFQIQRFKSIFVIVIRRTRCLLTSVTFFY